MRRLNSVLGFLILVLPEASAQISSGGSASVSGLLTHLLGINFSEPYVAIGFTATFALMWVSVYVIFKVGIKKIDSGYGGRRSNPLGDALGLKDDSRNLLAVLTLLITLSMVGTGAFFGLIRGWQSLILLAFTFALLAGLIFILIGGTGGIIGGTAYITGKSAKFASDGVKELKSELNSLRSEEESLEELEEDIEDEEDDARRRERRLRDRDTESGRDRSEGGSEEDEGDVEDERERRETERTEAEVRDIIEKLEKAISILEDIESKLSGKLSEESERISSEKELLEELEKIFRSDESPYRSLRQLYEEMKDYGLEQGSSREEFRDFLEKSGDLPSIIREEEELREMISDLERVHDRVMELSTEIELLRETQELIDRLHRELAEADEEEEFLEKLVQGLKQLRENGELPEEVKRSKDELEDLERRFSDLNEFKKEIKEFLENLEALQSDLGDLDSIASRLEEMINLIEGVESSIEEDFSSRESFSVVPGADDGLEPGIFIEAPGLDEGLIIDCSLEPGSHTDKKPFEFYDRFKPLVSEFTEPAREFIRYDRIYEDKDIEEGLANVFEMINGELNSKSSGDFSGEASLSSLLSGPSFVSHTANTVYLAFLIQHFWLWYRWHIADGSDTPRIGAKPVVKRASKANEVDIVSYSVEGRQIPCVRVKGGEAPYILCPATGQKIEGIDESKLGKLFYSFEK